MVRVGSRHVTDAATWEKVLPAVLQLSEMLPPLPFAAAGGGPASALSRVSPSTRGSFSLFFGLCCLVQYFTGCNSLIANRGITHPTPPAEITALYLAASQANTEHTKAANPFCISQKSFSSTELNGVCGFKFPTRWVSLLLPILAFTEVRGG